SLEELEEQRKNKKLQRFSDWMEGQSSLLAFQAQWLKQTDFKQMMDSWITSASSVPNDDFEIVTHRSGSVLNANTILKMDMVTNFNVLLSNLPNNGTDLTLMLEADKDIVLDGGDLEFGYWNLYMEPKVGVASLAQPTVPVLRQVLQKRLQILPKETMKLDDTTMMSVSSVRSQQGNKDCDVLWVDLREEPVVYIKECPYVIRHVAQPFLRLSEFGDLEAKHLHEITQRLKHDIMEEARHYHNDILGHEEEVWRQLPLKGEWIPLDLDDLNAIQTPAQVVKNLRKQGYRIKQVFEMPTLDRLGKIITEHATKDVTFIFTCGNGRERSTVATILTILICYHADLLVFVGEDGQEAKGISLKQLSLEGSPKRHSYSQLLGSNSHLRRKMADAEKSVSPKQGEELNEGDAIEEPLVLAAESKLHKSKLTTSLQDKDGSDEKGNKNEPNSDDELDEDEPLRSEANKPISTATVAASATTTNTKSIVNDQKWLELSDNQHGKKINNNNPVSSNEKNDTILSTVSASASVSVTEFDNARKKENERTMDCRAVNSLIRVLRVGREIKNQVDAVIEHCSQNFNLRESIYEARDRYEQARTSKEDKKYLMEAVRYVLTYSSLICYNAYLFEHYHALNHNKTHEKKYELLSFQEWTSARPELGIWRKDIQDHPESALMFTEIENTPYADVFTQRTRLNVAGCAIPSTEAITQIVLFLDRQFKQKPAIIRWACLREVFFFFFFFLFIDIKYTMNE
ncbi:hypothetical protein RFI_06697, partial [Reticulomyxa filosa]